MMTVQPLAQATPRIAEANAAVKLRLPFADTEEFDDARRGRLGSLSDGLIRATDGRVVWDADAYGFLDDECPDTGVLVIDPLISAECAAAALALYREHRGDRPVTGLLYTHSHVDHLGGSRGVVSADDVASGRVPVLALAGFLSHAVSENVYAGGAMTRRATYMYGALLPKG